MKRFFVALLFMSSLSFAAPGYIEQPAKTVAIKNVSVSTTTATAIYTGSANLTARTKIVIQNVDPDFDLYVGTHSAVTTSTGFSITNSSDSATAKQDFPISGGLTLYGLGQNNATRGSLDIRVIEYAQ